MVEIIIILFGGIIIGLLLSFSCLWLIKVKCLHCKQPKPLQEIMLFHWPERVITGQLCQKCQAAKPKAEVEL